MRAAIFVTNAYTTGRVAAQAHSFSPRRSDHGRKLRSTCFSRSLRINSGSGILTGHTTPHWLQSVAAFGRSSAFSIPT